MLAVAGEPPAQLTGWALELKWDGMRALAIVETDQVRLLSRNGNDITAAYPELDVLVELAGGRELVLDGEIVCISAAGHPDFRLLQTRMHVRNPAWRTDRLIPHCWQEHPHIVHELATVAVPSLGNGVRRHRCSDGGVATGHPAEVSGSSSLSVDEDPGHAQIRRARKRPAPPASLLRRRLADSCHATNQKPPSTLGGVEPGFSTASRSESARPAVHPVVTSPALVAAAT